MSCTSFIPKFSKFTVLLGFTSVCYFVGTSQNRVNEQLELKEIQAYPLNEFKLDLTVT